MPHLEFKPAANIVTFHPVRRDLIALIAKLCHQVKEIFIIDNTPSSIWLKNIDFQCPHVRYFHIGKNCGVAAAQNYGIMAAREDGATHVVLFDQDSLPEPEIVATLFRVHQEAKSSTYPVAAVGPLIIDSRTGIKRPFYGCRKRRKKFNTMLPSGSTYCDYLISSGSLISIETLNAVGLMEDALFIDCVDIEWGYRAAESGFYCIGTTETEMSHSIGTTPKKLFTRYITSQTAMRNYYYFRNCCRLIKRPYVSARWKWKTFIRSILYAIYLSSWPVGDGRLRTIIKAAIHDGLGENPN